MVAWARHAGGGALLNATLCGRGPQLPHMEHSPTVSEINSWLGFILYPNIVQVVMAANKHLLVVEVLQVMVEGSPMKAKASSGHGGEPSGPQRPAAHWPSHSSSLSSLWAWKMATTTMGKPPKVDVCWPSCCDNSSKRPLRPS